ncbi:uncharacterized protein LOC134233238 [Saccostrea cucullata]|uniref:uncharacterized protein LOC134233238 n=1 Tax=Saccostrea cuccullata TaxID=36930 RepID=UPI002ED16989
MDTMKEIGIIINMIVCCFIVKGNITTYNWFDAQQLCRNSSKRLTTNASDSMDFIWTGRHKIFSQWIKILGCYKDSSLRGELIINMTDLEYPSIGLCQEHCLRRNYSVYAIKATECVCLQKDFKGIQLSWDECDRDCLNADDILSTECGGDEAFTVFSTETSNQFTDVEKRCIALMCEKDVSRFKPFDCSSPLGIICSISEIYVDQKRWRLSFQKCKSINSTNQNRMIDLSKAEEACDIINITFDAPLWIGIVRENYVSEDQGESILDKSLVTKCQKCKYSHCEFVTCSEKNITDVNCTDLSTKIPDNEPPGESNLDIRLIIGPATAVFVVGTAIIIFLILCKRKRRQPKTKETPATKTDYEIVQKRKISNKNKRYTKDDIRHLGHSNLSYIETTEVVKEQEIPYCTKQDGDYDELHQTKSRKIERSDIFHYSLHLPPTYNIPCQEEKKDTIVESGYDVAFTNRISKIELSKCHQENV